MQDILFACWLTGQGSTANPANLAALFPLSWPAPKNVLWEYFFCNPLSIWTWKKIGKTFFGSSQLIKHTVDRAGSGRIFILLGDFTRI